jgi:hypothetical protein
MGKIKIDKSVGRHTQNPRRPSAECRVEDQKTVIGLLNRIRPADGGPDKTLDSTHLQGGTCSKELYDAIVKFENKQFAKGPHSGFVDPVRNPGKALFDKMVELAKPSASTPAAAEPPLDILRRNVQDVNKLKGKWSAGDRVKMDQLVEMAVANIDRLKLQENDKLAWYAEILGASYVISKKYYSHARDIGTPDPLSMRFWWRFGHVLTWTDNISTDKDPVLILFQDGTCAFVASEVDDLPVAALREAAKQGFTLSPEYPQTQQRLRQIELRTAVKRLRGW